MKSLLTLALSAALLAQPNEERSGGRAPEARKSRRTTYEVLAAGATVAGVVAGKSLVKKRYVSPGGAER